MRGCWSCSLCGPSPAGSSSLRGPSWGPRSPPDTAMPAPRARPRRSVPDQFHPRSQLGPDCQGGPLRLPRVESSGSRPDWGLPLPRPLGELHPWLLGESWLFPRVCGLLFGWTKDCSHMKCSLLSSSLSHWLSRNSAPFCRAATCPVPAGQFCRNTSPLCPFRMSCTHTHITPRIGISGSRDFVSYRYCVFIFMTFMHTADSTMYSPAFATVR